MHLLIDGEDRTLYLAGPIGPAKISLTLLGESDLLREGGGGMTLTRSPLFPNLLLAGKSQEGQLSTHN